MRSSAASSNVGSASESSDGVDDLHFLAELLGDDADGVVGQRLRERRHLAHAHELLDDLGDGDAEVLGDVLDGRAGVDLDDVGARLRALVERRDRVVVRAAATPAAPARGTARRALGASAGTAGATGAATGCLGVDDDASPATGARVAGRALAAQVAAVGTTGRRATGAAGCAALALARGCARTRAAALACAALRARAAWALPGGLPAAVAGARAVALGLVARRDARARALRRRFLSLAVLRLGCLDGLAGDGALGLRSRRPRRPGPSPRCRQRGGAR